MSRLLRATLAFTGWVLATIIAVLLAAAASLLVASAVPVPVVFLGAGWIVLAVAFADIAGAIPGSALVYVRGAGHSLYVERAHELMAELRAFIAGEPLPIPPMQTLAPPPDLDGPIGIAD